MYGPYLKNSIHPSLTKRKIIHVDMDAFYASVELRDRPELKDKPVVIGGSPNSRGVVCTANYVARKYGIRSAMACSQAYRRCPDAIFLPTNFEKYKEVSGQIREIFGRYTDLIEPLSLDEAFLDVTESSSGLYAVKIACNIREAIRSELSLTASAGVAPNKMIAKIASDFHKPDGITIVLPDKAEAFMASLSLRKIPGIGPKTEERLNKLGLGTCDDVKKFSLEDLSSMVGDRMGDWLYDRSRGIDERAVEVSWERKSLGKEETFQKDISDRETILEEIKNLSDSVSRSLIRQGHHAKAVTLKIKYDDFKTITRSKTLSESFRDAPTINGVAAALLDKTEAGTRPIRLVGVSTAICAAS